MRYHHCNNPPFHSASDGKAEFLTYICLTTGDLSSHMRRVVIDQYMTNFRQILEQQEAEIKQEWNIVLPMETAVKIFMTGKVFTHARALREVKTYRGRNGKA